MKKDGVQEEWGRRTDWVFARCHGCGWRVDGPTRADINPLVRRHIQSYAHAVEVDRVRHTIVTWGPR